MSAVIVIVVMKTFDLEISSSFFSCFNHRFVTVGFFFLLMRKPSRVSSTIRQKRLVESVELLGKTMIRKYSLCAKHNHVFKVNDRSGRCSECLRRSQRCEVWVTKFGFKDWSLGNKNYARGKKDLERRRSWP